MSDPTETEPGQPATSPARAELRFLLGALRLEARRRADLGQAAIARPTKSAESPTTRLSTQQGPTQQAPTQQPAEQVHTAQPAVVDSTQTPGSQAPAGAPAAEDLAQLAERVAACRACNLCESRQQTVFADGSPAARVMFVGEAPGAEEDRQGIPFVGRAGRLLTDIVTKGMGLQREEVYIANILKCRPPDNRDPSAEEKKLCTPFLERQIELVDPEVIIPLGRHAAAHLLGSEGSMGSMRGQVHQRAGRRIVATYHPAYLLRTPSAKKDTWADIQLAMGELGLKAPAGRSSGAPGPGPGAG